MGWIDTLMDECAECRAYSDDFYIDEDGIMVSRCETCWVRDCYFDQSDDDDDDWVDDWDSDVDLFDDWDWCYECGGYGDDYYIDDDGELVSSCDTCPYNPYNEEDD